MDPFYNQFAVGGVTTSPRGEQQTYLGYTDLYGTTFTDNYVATGFGAHFALPLLRKGFAEKGGLEMSEVDAKKLVASVMRVLFYRDCKTINKITFGKVDTNGVDISEPISVQTDWNLEEINPVKNPDPTMMEADEAKADE